VDTSTWNDLFLAHWAGSDRPAIVTPDGSWTGEELLHRAAGSAAWLDELGFAVVVGVPHRRWGEIVKAVIVARDPADPPRLTTSSRSPVRGWPTTRCRP
jgi:acyl-CoA synthetase (AMP-forming)/AMP-acid ligase II